ncbi:unnamed protein product [Linum tenue]|uniref:Uncharacterized protein n=1 Tax=Linum tenue TaxID=586396 RepID=A0AAV0QZM0_9ROSI|nr:unnamed protein product [Linum tenue]
MAFFLKNSSLSSHFRSRSQRFQSLAVDSMSSLGSGKKLSWLMTQLFVDSSHTSQASQKLTRLEIFSQSSLLSGAAMRFT